MQGHLPYFLGGSTLGGFVPTDIAGCVLWLRSDLGVTKDGGDLVSNWADQSGNGNDIAQAVGGNQPTWTASQINGYAALTFDGTSDYMFTAGFTLNQPTDIYVVIRQVTYATKSLFDGVVINTGRCTQLFAANNLALYAGTGWACENTDTELAWMIFQARFNGASSLTRVNSGTPVTGNPGAGNMGGLMLGAYAGGADPCNMQVAEIIIYNSALLDEDRNLVENYLNGRYTIY